METKLMRNWRDILDQPGLELKCAHDSLKEPHIHLESLKALLTYFDKICTRKYKEEWIFNEIFRLKYLEKDYDKYCIATVNAARVTLSRTLSNIDKIKEIETTKAFLIDLICDLKPYIQVVDNKQDMNWMIINTNNSDSYFYFDIITKILHDKDYYIPWDAIFGVSVLIIRHSIELKIKRSIGIDYIETQNGKPVSFSNILDIFKRLSGLKKKTELSLDRIVKINELANHHLHRGLRFTSWQLDWAKNELEKLFYRGITSNNLRVSTYAAFETTEIMDLRSEFEKALGKDLPGAKIKWLMNSEIVDFGRTRI